MSTLKSAEEWVKRVTHVNGHVDSMYVEDVRAIQADALRHAAEIARDEVMAWEGFAANEPKNELHEKRAWACERVQLRIEEAAAKLEGKQ
jgi:hypothetical protein